MRGYAFTLAVVGVVASAATFALNAIPESINLRSHKLKQVNQDQLEAEFNKFLAAHSKSYETQEEYIARLEQFKQSKLEISRLNSQNSGAVFGINEFSDWTEEEYQQLLGGKQIFNNDFVTVESFNENAINGPVDWRQQGKVNSVKNQGSCGSCWAFSAAASMESMHAIKTGKLERLSEQEIVDCSHTYNYGCNGGMYDRAWGDIKTLGGIMTEGSYPYTGKQGTCRFNKAQAVATVTSYKVIPANNPEQIKAALANGPVSIGLAAGNKAFQSYTGGVWDGSGCATNLDHAVTAVGWGNTAGSDFFIIRNSWGSSWGESGYIRLKSQSGIGACGMNQYPAQVQTN